MGEGLKVGEKVVVAEPGDNPVQSAFAGMVGTLEEIEPDGCEGWDGAEYVVSFPGWPRRIIFAEGQLRKRS